MCSLMKIDPEKIAALAADVAREESVEIVDVVVGREGPRSVIRIFIDREGGVRISDCESFSRKVGAVLDVEDPVPGPYSLEVSSPGINRRLAKPAHFAAAAGRRVHVVLSEAVDGCRRVRGTLVSCGDDGIAVDREGTILRIPFPLIRKANIEVAQEELFAKGKKKR